MIYLDYAATNPYPKFFTKDYLDVPIGVNPNANYAHQDREILIECEARIKKALRVKTGHILYFRTATDSAEWLSKFFCEDEVWCSPYEHDSLYQLCNDNVCEPTNSSSTIPDRYFYQDFILYFQQLVNPLNGRVFDIEEKACGMKYNNTHFFVVDGTQGIGKTPIPNNIDEYADGFIMSGHKIGCPDLSFLWISDNLCDMIECNKSIRNQWGMKHGTLTVASVCALVDAVESAVKNVANNIHHYNYLFQALNTEMRNNNIRCTYNQAGLSALNINLITLSNINGEALQTWLATKECYVGIAGSSCGDNGDFRVAKALGLSQEEAEHSIRVSFGEETTVEEIKEFVNLIKEFKNTYVH